MKYGTFVRISVEGDLKENCDKAFQKLQDKGIDTCQLSFKPEVLKAEYGDVIRESAAAHHVEISAHFCGLADGYTLWDNYFDFHITGLNSDLYGAERMKYFLNAIPFEKRLGVTDVITHAGFVPNNPFSPEYTRMLCAVRLLGGRLKAAGLNLLFETGGETPVALLRLIEETGLDNLYINLDTANLLLYGNGNPADALYTFGKYVRNMHCKDGFPPTDPKKLGREVELGEGLADFDRIIPKLAELGYDRYMIIEREIGDGQEEEKVLKAIHFLKEKVAKYYGNENGFVKE